MDVKKYLIALGCGLLLNPAVQAQSAADYALQLEASVQTAPPKVSLNWRSIPSATSYSIQRKAKTALMWSSLASTTDTFYVDASVLSDSAYEYRLTNSGGTAAGGYIFAGINAPAIHNKGRLLVLVDTLIRDSCATSVAQLLQDLSGDGWALVRHDIPQTMPDTLVKKIIKADYDAHGDVKAVMLLGHIAVPYSGEINPDGHPDHIGAWPADVFYADIDGIWTDATINNATASRSQNQNIPGDGKWDQSILPTVTELQVSRIDLSNMPLFGKSEVGLMNSYLAKAHQFKMDALTMIPKALVDDNFGAFGGEAFAANAWRNFPSLLGRNQIVMDDFISTLNDSAYLWAYGCGGGSYTSCGGVGTTANIAANKQKGIFSMLFGSYFGDWNTQNNFLRAPLCAEEPALTACWAGRPNWFLHHMSLGESIGYSARLTQNNSALYTPYGYGTGFVHVALMGDLSLRAQYIKPAGIPVISARAKGGADITWAASADASVLGYYVYRSDSIYGTYSRISPLLTGLSFEDTVGASGLYYYMVRPCRLEQTYSGTYYNLGIGMRDSASAIFPLTSAIAAKAPIAVSMLCFPNPTLDVLNVYAALSVTADRAEVRILDMSGSIVWQGQHSFVGREFTLSLPVSDWSRGIYVIQMSVDKGFWVSSKFVKE